MTKIDVDLSEMCTASSIGPILVPEMLAANDLMQLCHQFSGRMFVIEDESTRQIAVDLRKTKDKCFGAPGYLAGTNFMIESFDINHKE